MAFALSELFWIGLLPSATAALAMLLCRRFTMRPSAAWAVSVGVGLIVGQGGLSLRHGTSVALALLTHPSGARDWLPWLVLTATGITVLAAYAPRALQRWVFTLACVFASAAPIRLFAGGLTQRWSLGEKLAVIAFTAAAFLALWTTFALGRANRQPWLRGGLTVVVALGMAATITLSGAFTLGELTAVVAAVVAGAYVGERCFSYVVKKGTGSRRDTESVQIAPDVERDSPLIQHDGFSGAAGPLALMLGSLILLGYFYARLSATAALLLAVALTAAAGRLPTAWPPTPAGRIAFRIALCLIPLAVAIAVAWAANSGDPYAS